MGEAVPQVHGDQGDDLDGLPRADRLFDKDVLAGPANIGDQPHLVMPELLGGWFHVEISPYMVASLLLDICTDFANEQVSVKVSVR